MRSSTTMYRRNICGRGGSEFDAIGAEASNEGGDVGGIGDSNGPVPRSVVCDGETEVLGTDRVDLNMVELREAVDKEGEVRWVSIFDTEVVDNESKGDVASGVTKKTGGGSFVKVRSIEEPDKAILRQFTSTRKTVHAFTNSEIAKRFARFLSVEEVSEAKSRESGRRVSVSIDFDIFKLRHEGTEVEVSKVDSGKVGIFSDNSVE